MTPEEHVALVLRAKAELRKRLRGLRQTTPASALAKRSARIVEQAASLAVMTAAKCVALFWPMEERHEVDLRGLDELLRARGASVAYPSIDVESGGMTFRLAKGAQLEDDPLGFRSAPASAPLATPDVIVVPAIALDEHGRRLGYGAGFYDRALTSATGTTKVGVAYDFQLLVEVPTSEHDVSMDIVLTDARIIYAQ